MAKTFQEYQKEKRERDWSDKVKKQKAAMGNTERVEKAAKWKIIGNEKVKAGNLHEAVDYYREAVMYIEDLVEARKKERNELLVPLYSNLAHVYLKLGDPEPAVDMANKAIVICNVQKNGFGPGPHAKALFRRGVARRALGRLEDAREDLVAALKLQPSSGEVSIELSAVKGELVAQAQEARAKMGGFLNEHQQREEKRRQQEEKKRQAEERRKQRKALAEQRQQMQQAFSKISMGEMLYEAREKEMEPVRQKEKEKRQTLELEQNLLNILDESKGQPKTEKFDEFWEKKMARCQEQNLELDQKKKVLDKQRKEQQWDEDSVWRGQRDRHRQKLEEERVTEDLRQVGPRSMWESREVDRWCQQHLRDMLMNCAVEVAQLDVDLARMVITADALEAQSYVLKALVTDVLKLVGDASVVRLNASKPPLYYFDYFLKLEWEVAVAKKEECCYRSAEELISVAAMVDGGRAPDSVARNRVLAGTFKIKEFCSEEEPDEGTWELTVKVKNPCTFSAKLASLAEELSATLRGEVVRRLNQWILDYRTHWHC